MVNQHTGTIVPYFYHSVLCTCLRSLRSLLSGSGGVANCQQRNSILEQVVQLAASIPQMLSCTPEDAQASPAKEVVFEALANPEKLESPPLQACLDAALVQKGIWLKDLLKSGRVLSRLSLQEVAVLSFAGLASLISSF